MIGARRVRPLPVISGPVVVPAQRASRSACCAAFAASACARVVRSHEANQRVTDCLLHRPRGPLAPSGPMAALGTNRLWRPHLPMEPEGWRVTTHRDQNRSSDGDTAHHRAWALGVIPLRIAGSASMLPPSSRRSDVHTHRPQSAEHGQQVHRIPWGRSRPA